MFYVYQAPIIYIAGDDKFVAKPFHSLGMHIVLNEYQIALTTMQQPLNFINLGDTRYICILVLVDYIATYTDL